VFGQKRNETLSYHAGGAHDSNLQLAAHALFLPRKILKKQYMVSKVKTSRPSGAQMIQEKKGRPRNEACLGTIYRSLE
jgi:hypothetical protein